MKNLILILILLVSTNGISQQIKTNLTPKKTNQTVDTNKITEQEIAYVTHNKDTLYVVNNMYPLINQLWKKPNYNGEVKPVIIPVASITELKNSLIARKENLSSYEKKNKGKVKSKAKIKR